MYIGEGDNKCIKANFRSFYGRMNGELAFEKATAIIEISSRFFVAFVVKDDYNLCTFFPIIFLIFSLDNGGPL